MDIAVTPHFTFLIVSTEGRRQQILRWQSPVDHGGFREVIQSRLTSFAAQGPHARYFNHLSPPVDFADPDFVMNAELELRDERRVIQ
jgi:hypothetical protein